MMGNSKDSSLTVVQELQREIERQADLIYQLRQDNVALKTKLDAEQGGCQMCLDHLNFIEKEWRVPKEHVLVNPNDMDSRPASPYETGLYSTNNDLRLTIRTHLTQTPSDASWMEGTDSITHSDCGNKGECFGNKKKGKKKDRDVERRRSFFFRNGKDKPHRRTLSLRRAQTQVSCVEIVNRGENDQFQLSTDPNDIIRSSPSQDQVKQPKPVEQNVDQTYNESLSRMGWTDMGQKLGLLQESFSKQTDVFDDDVRFMREVLNGQSRAPEMDIEVELITLMKDFKKWKKQFHESVKDLHADVRKATNKKIDSLPPKNTASKVALMRKSVMAGSIGKLFQKPVNTDLEYPVRTPSVP